MPVTRMLRRACTVRAPSRAVRPSARSFSSKAPPESFKQWETAVTKEIGGQPPSKLTWRTAEVGSGLPNYNNAI